MRGGDGSSLREVQGGLDDGPELPDVAGSIFVLAWNARGGIQSGYLLWLGIAYLFVGTLDLLHTLAYGGMGVFQMAGSNLATQLWIAARYVEAGARLTAIQFVERKPRTTPALAGFTLVTTLLLFLIFVWERFPVCYDDAMGRLTGFKIASETAICLVLTLSLLLLFRKRRWFDPVVFRLLTLSIGFTIASELSFTLYADPFGWINKGGHLLKVVSFYLLYKALVETGITRPNDLLFRNLKASEASLRESENRYRSLVEFTQAPIVVHTLEKFLYLNPAACRLLGASAPEEILAKPVLHLVAPEDRRGMAERLQGILHRRETPPPHESRILRLDGTRVDVEAIDTPILYRATPAIQRVLRDATERKRAEEALHRSNEELEERVRERTAQLQAANTRLQVQIQERIQAEQDLRLNKGFTQTLLDGIPEPLYLLDRNLVVKQMNRATREYFRLEATRQAIGRPCHAAFRLGRTPVRGALSCSKKDPGPSPAAGCPTPGVWSRCRSTRWGRTPACTGDSSCGSPTSPRRRGWKGSCSKRNTSVAAIKSRLVRCRALLRARLAKDLSFAA